MKKIRFINITREKNADINIRFATACAERSIDYIEINPDEFSFTNPLKVKKGDLLYKSSVGKRSAIVQSFLSHQEPITLHKNLERVLISYDSFNRYRLKQVRQPKTIDALPRTPEDLKKASVALGGFPLIIKVTGGSHGVGVMKVDSLSALNSLADYFKGKSERVIMREFIPGGRSARLIVLGGKVIDSIEYRAPKGDFRSNVGATPLVQKKKFSKAIEQLAVKAVDAMDYDFGGVDILIHRGKGYVAETNFPCFFPRCSMVTGKDIAGAIIDHLIKKRSLILETV